MQIPFQQDTPATEVPDKDVTLGPWTLVGIGVGLILLCALCFGVGYHFGHASMPPATTPNGTPTMAQNPCNTPTPTANTTPAYHPPTPAAETPQEEEKTETPQQEEPQSGSTQP